MDKDKDLFIGMQEFVVGYSKAPEQPQSSARPICHSHAMTRTGREPATICTAAYGARALLITPRRRHRNQKFSVFIYRRDMLYKDISSPFSYTMMSGGKYV